MWLKLTEIGKGPLDVNFDNVVTFYGVLSGPHGTNRESTIVHTNSRERPFPCEIKVKQTVSEIHNLLSGSRADGTPL